MSNKRKSEYTYEQLQEMWELPFDEKVDIARKWLIDKRPCAFDQLTPRKNVCEALQYYDLLI